MTDFNVEDFIVRQLNGSLTAEELVQLRSWYDASDAHKETYRHYCVVLKADEIASKRLFFDSGKEAAWNRFLKRTLHNRKQQRVRKIILGAARYAAVIAIAFLAGIGVYHVSFSEKEASLQVVEVPFGSKSKISLPDGSFVWLNSGSRLTYHSDFGKNNRNLTLDGEGCFDVAKNKKLPFEVQSQKVKIKVLGTKFNLKAYSTDENTRVTLLEGSLNVIPDNNESHGSKLVPNEQAVIHNASASLKVNKVVATNYTRWTEAKKESVSSTQVFNASANKLSRMILPNTTLRNTLFFDEEPLSQIVRDLERAFNVSIEIKEPELKTQTYYGDFRNEETIFEILDIITSNSSLRYEVIRDKIIIEEK